MADDDSLSGSRRGLTKSVREFLKSTLITLSKQWLDEPASDLKRVSRPTEMGGRSISIEPYRGVKTYIEFESKISKTNFKDVFIKNVIEEQPMLSGYFYCRSGSLNDLISAIMSFVRAVSAYCESSMSIEDSVDIVIKEFDDVLISGSATLQTITALAGLALPECVDEIYIEEGIIIRRLTLGEIIDLESHDISYNDNNLITVYPVSVCIELRKKIPISFSEKQRNYEMDIACYDDITYNINNVLTALHVVEAGCADIYVRKTKILPSALYFLHRQDSMPLSINPFGKMELNKDKISDFVELYNNIKNNNREELRLSINRLVEAEKRLSPDDALLDAVMGLDILLSPNDNTELSFRMALNYAFLGEPDMRRRRFDDIRRVQDMRNRIVHRGLNARSKDAENIRRCADLAKNCLRDSICRLLSDKYLARTAKLDVGFWLDRVLPRGSE